MKTLLLLTILLVASLSQTDSLGASGDGLSSVSGNAQGDASQLPPQILPSVAPPPPGVQTFQTFQDSPPSWNFLSGPALGGASQWVLPEGTIKVYPLKWLSTFTIKFTTDCPQNPVILKLSTTGSNFVYINGNLIHSWGQAYPSIHSITIETADLICGCNEIKVQVYSFYFASPNALAYTLSQDKTNCYKCQNAGDSYYNRDTCKCECAFKCDCKANNPLQVWRNYPTCGCRCAALGFCTSGYYWNSKSCTCECQPVCCPQGMVQDKKSCKCVKQCSVTASSCASNEVFDPAKCQCVPKCLPFAPCPSGSQWNFLTCRCECLSVQTCTSPQVWDSQSCSCQCPNIPCTSLQVFNKTSCKCECASGPFCIATHTWNPNTCQCECSTTTPCPSHKVFNPRTCSCSCSLNPTSPSCVVNYMWNYDTCKC